MAQKIDLSTWTKNGPHLITVVDEWLEDSAWGIETRLDEMMITKGMDIGSGDDPVIVSITTQIKLSKADALQLADVLRCWAETGELRLRGYPGGRTDLDA